MTYVVGLTGAIGSGKTTLASFFAEKGVPIIDADQIAKDLVKPNTVYFNQIVHHFGSEVLKEDGELNRQQLRELIFTHPEHKLWLESLLHPVIEQIIQHEISKVSYNYCIVVIPLLAELYPRYRPFINHVLVIEIDKKHQLERLGMRDNHSKKLLNRIIASQADAKKRLKIADTVIHNNDNIGKLKIQVEMLNQQFIQLSKLK